MTYYLIKSRGMWRNEHKWTDEFADAQKFTDIALLLSRQMFYPPEEGDEITQVTDDEETTIFTFPSIPKRPKA